MPVIAIASETGSDGLSIAKHLAQRLGLSMLDHDNVVERLAQLGCCVPECPEMLALSGAAPEKNWQPYKIGKIISSEILFLAQKNCMLIHSPFAPHLLAGISHIPRIQVCAPVSQRARNFSVANGCSEADAERHIIRKDAQSNWILTTCFGVDSEQRAEHFDLVADTGWLSAQDWAEQILDLVQDPEFVPTAASNAKLHALVSHGHALRINTNAGAEHGR